MFTKINIKLNFFIIYIIFSENHNLIIINNNFLFQFINYKINLEFFKYFSK